MSKSGKCDVFVRAQYRVCRPVCETWSAHIWRTSHPTVSSSTVHRLFKCSASIVLAVLHQATTAAFVSVDSGDARPPISHVVTLFSGRPAGQSFRSGKVIVARPTGSVEILWNDLELTVLSIVVGGTLDLWKGCASFMATFVRWADGFAHGASVDCRVRWQDAGGGVCANAARIRIDGGRGEIWPVLCPCDGE